MKTQGLVLRPEHWTVLGWVSAYCVASASMTILNKAAIKAFEFPYWLCTMQNLATLLCLAVIVVIAPRDHKIFGLKTKVTPRVLLYWAPAAVLFTVMLVSAMSAMRTMSVTTVLVARSLTPLITALLERQALGVKPGLRTWLALLVILLGSVFYVAAQNQVDGDVPGYIWLGVNLAGAALYHVYVKFVIEEVKLSTMDMVLYNNTMSIPLLVVAGLLADHTSQLPAGFDALDGLGALWVILSCVCAGYISFSGFGMQAAISATSSTVVNHINKVVSFWVAHIVFHDVINTLMAVGLLITLGGTVWYSIERLLERTSKKPPASGGASTAPEGGKAADEKTPLQPGAADVKRPGV